jgi:hypothetical protein
MKLYKLDEPHLEFHNGTHICPRMGITSHEVYDARFPARRERILVGAVGTSQCLEKLSQWLGRLSQPIISTEANDRLHPSFCGFNNDVGYKAELVMVGEITRSLSNQQIKQIKHINNRNERITEAVNLYYQQVEFLARHRNVDVIVCIIPTVIYDKIAREEEIPLEESMEEQADDTYEFNFRRALKAKAMHLGVPLQLTREISLEANVATQQDDATKAWNFSTALYYKANKTVPWKLITNINRPSVCFAGIGFYRSRDRKALHTSLAQIFDELGNGVILRGTPVDLSKDDPVPHLSSEQANTLLKRALTEYETALNTSPGRLVLHKSSNFNEDELDGFRSATKEMRVRSVDFVTILDARMRLLRDGIYPPYRGTGIELDSTNHLLYTRGSVEHYRTYPGKYIPQPLEVRIVEADESANVICQEILSLTKMNWNNTQFDRKYPITIECARKVGLIMKYLSEQDQPQISYSFYM